MSTLPPSDSLNDQGDRPQVGDTYTHGHDESVLRGHRWRTAENSAGYLLHRLSPGDSVLDVGCGPGSITSDLAERVSPGRITALDRDPGVVDEAVASARSRGLTNVVGAVGDVASLDFDDGAFDVVHAHQVLQHLSDPVGALVEMGRVARAGGVVAVRDADYGAMCWYPADPGLDRWMELYQAVARANDAEPDAARRLLSWCHAAGFVEVAVSASAWCFADEGDRAWWAGQWAERVVRSDLARQALERRLSDREELSRIADGFRAWATNPDGWFLVPHGEVLITVPGPSTTGP